MKKLRLLSAVLIAATTSSAVSAQSTYSLVASDFQFDPLVLSINTGDTVRITLGPGHSFREVAQASWDLNVGTPAIGWEFDPSSELTVHDLVTTTPGTIYYVCVPHLDMGMKGRIVVTEGNIGIGENEGAGYRVVPNPTTGMVRVVERPANVSRVRVVDSAGRICLEGPMAPDGSIDMRSLLPGAYRLMLLDLRGKVVHNGMVILQNQ